jgi:hypothetical protein
MPNLDFQTMSNREGHETDFGRGNVIAIMEYRPEQQRNAGKEGVKRKKEIQCAHCPKMKIGWRRRP